jgi:hypothetical protein
MEPSLPACRTDTPPGSVGLGWRSGWRIEDDTIGTQSSNDEALPLSRHRYCLRRSASWQQSFPTRPTGSHACAGERLRWNEIRQSDDACLGAIH